MEILELVRGDWNSQPDLTAPTLSRTEISSRVQDWYAALEPTLPRAFDGEVVLTLFGHRMPSDWIWTQERLLPAVVCVGGYRCGLTVPLRRVPLSLLGVELAEDAPFHDEFLRRPLAPACFQRHSVQQGNRLIGPCGTNVEFMWLLGAGALWDAASAQGIQVALTAESALRAWDALPDAFFENPSISGLPPDLAPSLDASLPKS